MRTRIVATAPAGVSLGLHVSDVAVGRADRVVVTEVDDGSPLAGRIIEGDEIIAVNGARGTNAAGESTLYRGTISIN